MGREVSRKESEKFKLVIQALAVKAWETGKEQLFGSFALRPVDDGVQLCRRRGKNRMPRDRFPKSTLNYLKKKNVRSILWNKK